jgi:effector-binding domain-containing protein
MGIVMKLVVALVLLVAVLAGVGMLLPRNVHVERQITIDAPAATIFTLVDGFKMFNTWSPWAALDPDTKYAYEGPAFGVGARQTWAGDPKKVGSGSQEIIEAKPFELVVSKLDFTGQGPAVTRMALAPGSNGTQVTWGMDCDMGASPVGRYFGLFMDKFVGKDYELGLANLKKLAEGLPKADFAGLDVAVVDVVPIHVAYVEASSSKDEKEIASAIGAAYMKVGAFMKANGLQIAGAPMTINTRYDDTGYGFDAAIPVDKLPAKEVPADSPVKVKPTYGGRALKVVLKGPYSGMPATYQQIAAYMAARGYESAGPAWDEYITDPGSTPEAELRTNILQPIK